MALLDEQLANLARLNGVPATLDALERVAGAGFMVSYRCNWGCGNKCFPDRAQAQSFIAAYACEWISHSVFMRIRTGALAEPLLPVD